LVRATLFRRRIRGEAVLVFWFQRRWRWISRIWKMKRRSSKFKCICIPCEVNLIYGEWLLRWEPGWSQVDTSKLAKKIQSFCLTRWQTTNREACWHDDENMVTSSYSKEDVFLQWDIRECKNDYAP
jgi:hypothetical protein